MWRVSQIRISADLQVRAKEMGHLVLYPYPLQDPEDPRVILFAVESIDYIFMRWEGGLSSQAMRLQIYRFEYYNLMECHPSLPLLMFQICHYKEFFLLCDLESPLAKVVDQLIPFRAIIQA